jgi:hypothetical protein
MANDHAAAKNEPGPWRRR